MTQPSALPPRTEITTLRSCLDAQRHHVIEALAGLDEASVRRSVLPSGWSCVGLVNHLAVDVERFWFRGVITGEQAVVNQVSVSQDDAWQVGSDASISDVLDLYRQEAGRPTPSSSLRPLTQRRPGGRTSSGPTDSTIFARSSSTSSQRRPATPGTSTPPESCSTASSGLSSSDLLRLIAEAARLALLGRP